MPSVETALDSFRTKYLLPARVPDCECARRTIIAKATIASLVCAAMFGCCQPNDPSCRNVSFGPSGAEVAGVTLAVGAAVATVIAVEVHHAHHTLNGCVSSGPGGMQLHDHSGTKTYTLSGNTANLTAGDRVRLHGTRLKQPRHGRADPTFAVERRTKDYGPC